MKTFLTTLFLLTLSSQAIADTIAKYSFAVNTKGVVEKFDVSLTSEGTVEIFSAKANMANHRFFMMPSCDEGSECETKSVEISEVLFDDLKRKAITLSRADIGVEDSHVICMMIPSITMTTNSLEVKRDYDRDSDSFKGDLIEVDGPNGCWVRRHVHPKEKWAQGVAAELKSMMRTIALIK